MKRHGNESLNPGYQDEYFESQQAILTSLTDLRSFKSRHIWFLTRFVINLSARLYQQIM